MAELGAEGLEDMAAELEEFSDDLKEIRETLDEDIEEAVSNTAEDLHVEMERQILKYDARDTGELLNSITHDSVGKYRYAVGPTAEHAPYVEYGTPRHDITPEGITEEQVKKMSFRQLEASPIKPLTFVVDGELVKTYHVDHPGTDPQPFFGDAVSRARAEQWLEKELEDAVDRRFTQVLGR